MAKYEVGDSFIATITAVDDTGMGTVYALNTITQVGDLQLDQMEYLEKLALSDVTDEPKEERKTYTSMDLLRRIRRTSELLSDLISVYSQMTDCLEHLDAIDNRIEELSL